MGVHLAVVTGSSFFFSMPSVTVLIEESSSSIFRLANSLYNDLTMSSSLSTFPFRSNSILSFRSHVELKTSSEAGLYFPFNSSSFYVSISKYFGIFSLGENDFRP